MASGGGIALGEVPLAGTLQEVRMRLDVLTQRELDERGTIRPLGVSS